MQNYAQNSCINHNLFKIFMQKLIELSLQGQLLNETITAFTF